MSEDVNYFKAAEYALGNITKPGAMVPANRVLEPGDHGDVLRLAQVYATLEIAEQLADIAAELQIIRRQGPVA